MNTQYQIHFYSSELDGSWDSVLITGSSLNTQPADAKFAYVSSVSESLCSHLLSRPFF